jgi:3-hydroxyisobutyrate dehydrogenase-like beta-hydroxyacid dehydrogenase
MGDRVIGLLHPGQMGAAIGRALVAQGRAVLWASAGRGAQTVGRAQEAGLVDARTVSELMRRCAVLLSVCPPHAAVDVARAVTGFTGVFVDANAVSPATAREIAHRIVAGGGRFVDAGIVGPPPRRAGDTRLYLSGPAAGEVGELFVGTPVEARVVGDEIGAASALKMAYAGWTKGSAALLLAVRALARAEGVEEALIAEWSVSLPDLPDRSLSAARSATTKGWRWVGEMEEIAASVAAAGLPAGFHQAAAELFRRSPRERDAASDESTLDSVLAGLLVDHFNDRATKGIDR